MSVVDAGLFANGWLATLGMLAVQGTVLALFALVLTRAGKLRPAWQAAIWLVVVVKFALPWGPAMPWSLSDLVAKLTSSPEVAAAPFVLTDGMTRVVPSVSEWPAIGWLALATVWAIGAAVVLSRAVLAQRRTARAARAAVPAPAAAQALLTSLGSRPGLLTPLGSRPPRRTLLGLLGSLGPRTARLAVGAADVGPHVVGMLRPIIVVPPALLQDHVLLRAALLHELAHVRRGDALARLFQIAASTLLWWFPVVRLVQRRLERAREAACDAWALEAGGVGRPAYARLLVRMASLRTDAQAHALAAHHSLDARVAAVLGPPARARMSHLHRVIVAGFALLALGGARTASAKAAPDACVYTAQMAAALYDAFPDADRDGDGVLSRDEACDLQATLRRVPEERSSRFSADAEIEIQTLLATEGLCEPDPYASPDTTTCHKAEGATR